VIENEPTTDAPASFLQFHKNVTYFLDMAAASHLTRYQAPWLIKGIGKDPYIKYTRQRAI